MTPREKILRDGLEKMRDNKYEPKKNDLHDEGVSSGLYISRCQARHILKQADAVKGS